MILRSSQDHFSVILNPFPGAYYVIIFLGMTTSRLWLDCKILTASCATIQNQIIAYRRIQIFEKTLNSCIRDRIFLTLAFLGPLFQVLAGFALIEVANSKNISILVGCGLIYVVILIMTLLNFCVAGQINRLSLNWIKCRGRLCKSKIFTRKMKSLVSVRIQYGSNFVEALTPLVVQEFCVRQTTSLLLLRR